MRFRQSKLVAGLGLLAGGAFLLQAGTGGCAGFATRSALSAVDFCFIFDCQNGAFGGTIKPCPPVTQTGQNQTTPPLFVDCTTTTTP